MNRFLAVAIAAALAAIAPPANAQGSVCMNGLLQPVLPPSCGAATHRFECGNVELRSSAVVLDDYVGQLVRVTGVDVGTACPLLDVATIEPARTTLDLCGSPVLGCPIELTVCPVLQGVWALWVSTSPGFYPLGCARIPNGVDGTIGLGLPIYSLGGGALATCGVLQLTLPTHPAFVGLELYFQGMRQQIGPVGPREFTNVRCATIRPGGPCLACP